MGYNENTFNRQIARQGDKILKFKKTVLIDLDGVLNTYTGSYIANYIPPLKNGAKEFIEELCLHYKLKIFTTRDKNLVQHWILQNKLENFVSEVTNQKEPCHLYIDDRCICFDGNYSGLKTKIDSFKPWYKRYYLL